MAKFDVFRKKSMDADIRVSGLDYVEPPEMSFEVKAEVDNKAYDQIEKDTILLTEMNKAAKEIYDQTCAGIKKKLGAFEKLAETMVDGGAKPAEIKKQLDGLNNSIEKDREIAEVAAADAVEKVWRDYGRKKKEYSAYKIKVVATVVASLAGLVASIATMATSPFTGGVGAAAALVGMLKSAVQIGRELGSAWQSVETAVKLLGVQATIVEKAAKTMAGRRANEYTAAIVTQFLGIAQPSIKSCKTHLDTVESKLKGVEVKTHDAGIAINDLLDQQEALKKDFMKEAGSRLDKHPSSKAKDQKKEIEKALDLFIGKSRSDVIKQKDVVGDLYKRFMAAESDVAAMSKRVDALVDLREIDERLLRAVLSAVELPLGIAEAALSKSADIAAEIASTLAPWVTEFAYEQITDRVTAKTLLDS